MQYNNSRLSERVSDKYSVSIWLSKDRGGRQQRLNMAAQLNSLFVLFKIVSLSIFLSVPFNLQKPDPIYTIKLFEVS